MTPLSKNFFVLFFYFVFSSVLNAQWSFNEHTDYTGAYKIAALSDVEKSGVYLIFQRNDRDNTGLIYLYGTPESDLDIYSTAKLNYNDFAISFRFDNDPKVYYAGDNWYVKLPDGASLYLSTAFDLNSNDHFEFPVLGISNKRPNIEDQELLWNSTGMIYELRSFLSTLKQQNKMYVAFWKDEEIYYYTFDLKGSAAAINKIFPLKYEIPELKIPLNGVRPVKCFSNELNEFKSHSLDN